MPFVSRTRATLRKAEFGFLGMVVYTRVHTPRFCGAPRRAVVLTRGFGAVRPLRTSWLTVGICSFLRGKGPTTQQRLAAGSAPRQPAKHGSESLSRPSNARNPHRSGDFGALRPLSASCFYDFETICKRGSAF